ncbi:MAG: 2-polyprenyl-3-methyl-6-methoxy-1,4-benzoquinone monooxygenase [Gammaproteobacteria bacterium]
MTRRTLTPLDRVLLGADQVLRTLCGAPQGSGRPNPAGRSRRQQPGLEEADRRRSGRLMRVNFAGEVAAQALYHGQAVGARNPTTAERLRHAAREENDHLIWCRERLAALETPASLLNPFWYAGSFALGALAGAIGDRVSLGFLEETERQVVEHLEGHLERLPDADEGSRRVLEQMRTDEARHGAGARAAGGCRPLPPIRFAMRCASRVMTTSAYWM